MKTLINQHLAENKIVVKNLTDNKKTERIHEIVKGNLQLKQLLTGITIALVAPVANCVEASAFTPSTRSWLNVTGPKNKYAPHVSEPIKYLSSSTNPNLSGSSCIDGV